MTVVGCLICHSGCVISNYWLSVANDIRIRGDRNAPSRGADVCHIRNRSVFLRSIHLACNIPHNLVQGRAWGGLAPETLTQLSQAEPPDIEPLR